MIRVNNLSYWHQEEGNATLRDISLSVVKGESVCLMGRNGSGKSTLALLIAGLLKPTRGDISIGNKPATDQASRSRIGIIFQNPDNQMIASVVEKEIAFALENQAMPQEQMEIEVSDIADKFGITHLLNRLTTDLSGGEKQRVALAAIMIRKPEILILDEPDAYLDETGRKLLNEQLLKLHETDPGLIEIRITQSHTVARNYPRLIVLHEGRTVADSQTEEIFSDHSFAIQTGLILDESDKLYENLNFPKIPNLSKKTSPIAKIIFNDVSFAYQPESKFIIENCNFTLNQGETVCLVGPTGAGKSSLALLACSLLKPLSGKVEMYDQSGTIIPDKNIRGEVVTLLQQPEKQFFLHSCEAELKFGPANFGCNLTSNEVKELLEITGLPTREFAERDPFTLSTGEKRRLALSCLIGLNPSILIFDEPTAGLDQEGIGRFLQFSKNIKKSGAGQLLICHEGELIDRLADRVLYLKNSCSLLEIEKSEFLNNPIYNGIVSPPLQSLTKKA